MASEGAFVAFAPKEYSKQICRCLYDLGMKDATIIGQVGDRVGHVTMINQLGIEQVFQRPFGDHLPRIC